MRMSHTLRHICRYVCLFNCIPLVAISSEQSNMRHSKK